MKKQIIRARFIHWLTIWLLIGVGLFVSLYIGLMSGCICRKTIDIDLNSGLMRHRTSVLFICVDEEIKRVPSARVCFAKNPSTGGLCGL